MAFTRKMLKALGIEEDKIDQIMDAHTEVTDALKKERDNYKADAEKLPDVQKELDKVTKDLEAVDKDEYKEKYETEKAAHDKLKSDIADKETAAKKDAAIAAWLKEKGYSENGAKKIVKYGGYRDKVKFDKDGKPENLDDLEKEVAAEWGEYKGEEKSESPKGGNPVTGGSEPKKQSRAAQIWADYNKSVYGETAADSNKEGN